MHLPLAAWLTISIFAPKDRGFVDSPLEGAGFEPTVPRRGRRRADCLHLWQLRADGIAAALRRLLPRDVHQPLSDLSAGKVTIPLGGATTFAGTDFFSVFRQNVLEGMLADPMYGGNQKMIGWRWVGFPGDPMRRGDPYANWIFKDKPYPYEHKPMPMKMLTPMDFMGGN